MQITGSPNNDPTDVQEVEVSDKAAHVKLKGSNVIDTAILEANPNTTTYNLPTASKRIAVVNTSRYVAAWVTVNAKKIRIEPRQTAKIFGENITSLDYSSAVGKAILQIIMGDIDIAMSNDPPISKSYMEKHSWQIFAARGNELFRVSSSTKISYSNDMGATWTTKKDMTPAYATTGHITNAGTLLFFTSDGNLHRSTDDGQTTTQVKTGIRSWRAGGIAQNGNTIIFAEYGTDEGTYNIWRSIDDGATWTSVFTQVAPTNIRHFHAVAYDPYDGKWYATSGDGDSQCIWFVSSNDGVTWTILTGASGSQKWRTTGLVFPGDGTVIWASDSDTNHMGIYKASLSTITTTTKLFHLDAPGLVTWSMGPNIAIATRVGGAVIGKAVPGIYISHDLGTTWQKELEWPIKPTSFSSTAISGFSSVWGPDVDGTYYIYVESNNIGRGGTEFIMGMKFRF